MDGGAVGQSNFNTRRTPNDNKTKTAGASALLAASGTGLDGRVPSDSASCVKRRKQTPGLVLLLQSLEGESQITQIHSIYLTSISTFD